MRQIIKSILDKMFIWGNDESSSSRLSDTKSIKLNPYTLSFPDQLENEFLKQYYEESILQINIFVIAGSILLAIFFPFDLFLVPEHFYTFLILRVGVVSIIVVSTILIINKAKNKNISQPALSFAIICVSIILIAFIVIANPKLNSYYYIGIILVYFWVYTFLKLRYIWASFTGIIIFILYELAMIFLVNLDQELLLISSAYLLSSNIAGMSIAYTLEYYARKDFYQKIMIKNSFNENTSLHKKISESDEAIGIAEEKLTIQSKALESAANSILIIDRDGKILWCNNAFTDLTGYTMDEVTGQNPRVLKSGKHSNLFYKNLWLTILKGKVWSGEIINKKKNGDLYYEEMTITPVFSNRSERISHFIVIKQDISLRKDMEEELYESEKRLRGLFENATMGLYRSNISGDILMANDALINMLGFDSLEELQNRDKLGAGYLDKGQREQFLQKLEASGNLKGFESEWQKKDGAIIHIRESARLYQDEKEEIIFEGTIEDITLSKIAESELRTAQERLQVIFDNLYDAVIIHDSEGKIIHVNNKVLDLYNVSPEAILECTIKDISANENSLDILESQWKNVINDGKSYKYSWKALRPNDHSVFDVEIFLSRISLNSKYYVLANIRDITDEKEANKKLLITQKAFELNATPIFWISKDSRFLYSNTAASDVLGYTADEFCNMRVSDIDKIWSDEFWNESGYPMLKEKRVAQFESICKKKDGKEFPSEINASIINYDDDEIIIAILTDISERKKVAENLVKAKEKAEQSDKLKSEFLAGMSHEIRTPINTILNFISLIRSDLGEDVSDDIKESFEMIDNGSRRLIRTIDSILNMSQLQSGSYELKIEPIPIVENIITPLVKEFQQVADQKGLKFNIDNNINGDVILGDHYTISQLLINLIDNSLKYTQEGTVTISIDSNSSFVIIKIIDTGIGISKEFLPTLFDPFIQEEMGYTRSFEGNGLGLALVKNYVDLNKGTIHVNSTKGLGSTFTVKLNKAPWN